MTLTDLEKQLINKFQKSFPMVAKPYQLIAQELKSTEEKILMSLQNLKEKEILSRVGPVFQPNKIGVSTLAALRLPKEKLDRLAEKINKLESVNHNYEREHQYNLWFVVTAPDQSRLDLEIEKISVIGEQKVLVLPLEKEYFIDLGFDIDWGNKE